MEEEILQIINECPTPYHYVAKAREMLVAAGYVEIQEQSENESIPPRFFMVQDETTIFACNVKDTNNAIILATANDGSCFKLKPRTFQTAADVDQARIAPSGDAHYWTWLDRELCLAGRIIYNTPEGPKSKLIRTEKPIAIIPSLAIHLDRTQMTEPKWNLEDNFVPILSLASSCDVVDSQNSPSIMKVIKEDVISSDLSFIDSNPAQLIGISKDILAGMNLSTRAGAIAGLRAFLQTDEEPGSRIFCSYSTSRRSDSMRNGPGAVLLPWILERLAIQNAYLIVNENYNGNIGCSPRLKCNQDKVVYTSIYEQAIATQLLGLKRITVSGNETAAITTASKLVSKTGLPSAVIGIPFAAMNSIRESCAIKDVIELEGVFAKALKITTPVDTSVL